MEERFPLYEYFVPLDLSTERRVIQDADIVSLSQVSHHIVVTGSGGSGKTMLMRHLLVGCIQRQAKTPVFVELRQLNKEPLQLHAAVARSLRSHGLDADDAFIESALVDGQFLLILDGFDELDHHVRGPVVAEIRELATRYPHNWIIVSSRPDSELNELEQFTTAKVRPLRIESAIALVEKVPFEDEVKSRFLSDLRGGLFQTHSSFLSNPLLLSIMLLTYSDVAHIPNKLSLFYLHAYEALFQKHDALKGAFQRERRSPLDIQDFASAFSTFCLLTYSERVFAFSRTLALGYLDKAKTLSQISYRSSDVLDDSLQAVCLLIEEGLDLTFAHRSFQEYFVARYIAISSPSKSKESLIKSVVEDIGRDSVLSLLYEMDQASVERVYVLPGIGALLAEIGDGGTEDERYLRLLQLVFDEFSTTDTGVVARTYGRRGGDRWMPFLYFCEATVLPAARPDSRIIDQSRERELLLLESPTGRVRTTSLTTASPFLRHLADSGIWFGPPSSQHTGRRGQADRTSPC